MSKDLLEALEKAADMAEIEYGIAAMEDEQARVRRQKAVGVLLSARIAYLAAKWGEERHGD